VRSPLIVDVAFWTFGFASVVTAWLVFRADSMVRASFWLLASFLNVGAILLLLGSAYLSLILILMMAGEMAIMAVFMVMFMMNPAGLNPMNMVHQHRVAVVAGVVAFLALGTVGIFGRFPDRPAPPERDVTADLGTELLGNSMMVFESAGAALLATMIASIAIASSRGRYGSAEEGSEEPPLGIEVAAEREDAGAESETMAGMDGMEGMSS
jgi:NADH:ubiquinone oxidoreductase subunit 6 (subunit J)